jgi:hypothetical protein
MGSITVSHREYLGNVVGPADSSFTVARYAVNPGLPGTFPWLSQLAPNFDEYEFKQLMFEYKSMVADFASASGQVGQVIAATQYNSNLPPFPNKRAMLEYEMSMDCKTSQNMLHGVECDPRKLSMAVGMYTRSGPAQAGQALNTLDHGQFFLAVDGIPSTYANQILGELWVTYTVTLRKPKSFTNQGLGLATDIYITDTQNIGALPRQVDGTYVPVSALGQQNGIGCSFVDRVVNNVGAIPALSTTVYFPLTCVGAYEITAVWDLQNEFLEAAANYSLYAAYSTVFGNVAYNRDIWAPTSYSFTESGVEATPTPGTWVPQVSSTIVTSQYGLLATSTQVTLKVHVQVNEPLAGQTASQAVELRMYSTSTAPLLLQAVATQVQVQMYNTRLNNTITGAPILLDAAGTVVTVPPYEAAPYVVGPMPSSVASAAAAAPAPEALAAEAASAAAGAAAGRGAKRPRIRITPTPVVAVGGAGAPPPETKRPTIEV